MTIKQRLLTAAVLGIAAMACLWLYADEVALQAAGGAKVDVLVAATDLPPGKRLERKDLAVRSIPQAYVHGSSLRRGEEEQIVGRLTAAQIIQGQPILWTDLELSRSASKRISTVIQKGQRAITIPATPESSQAGMLRPGDHLDILANLRRPNEKGVAAEGVTITLMQNIPVISVGTEMGVRQAAEAAEKGTLRVATMTLSVDPEEAELLVFAQSHAALTYILRPVDDLDPIDAIPQKSYDDIFQPEKVIAFTKRHAHKKQTIQELKAN